jgi:molybdopterin/thiamine biosynthesis adenylyltransferase
MKNIYIIGAGGVGSWLTPAMCLLTNSDRVTIIDGDKLEKKNLNRQLFEFDQIGLNKAGALAVKYDCNAFEEFFSHGRWTFDASDWFMVGVDNNPARKAVLESCDQYGCKAIFGANETTSAEAYYYDPMWKGSQFDPRVYYPEILTDNSDDPRSEAIGCTGEAQAKNVQLVSANFMAAALMQHLYVLQAMEKPKLERSVHKEMMHRIRQNLNSYEFMKPNKK